MERAKHIDTSEAVKDTLSYAERVGLGMSPDQALELVTHHTLHTTRAITRAVSLIHAHTTSLVLDVLPHAHREGPLHEAPSLILRYLLAGSPEQSRELLYAIAMVPRGLDLDALSALFPDQALVDTLTAVQRWTHRNLLVADESMTWRVPVPIAHHIEALHTTGERRALVRRHMRWWEARFPYDPMLLYETFPSPERLATIWTHRHELLTLVRLGARGDRVGAARALLTFAPAVLHLGGREAFEELATHLELCIHDLPDGPELFHLMLTKAELLFRQTGQLVDTLDIVTSMRAAYIDGKSNDELELCLLQREANYRNLGGAMRRMLSGIASRLERLIEELDAPDFFVPQAMRIAHRGHDAEGDHDAALASLERAIEASWTRGLRQSALLCKLELMSYLISRGVNDRVSMLAQELLAEIDPAHSPRMYFFTKFVFGYSLYVRGEPLGEASMHFEQAIAYMESAQDTHTLLIAQQMLALCELEQDRPDQALAMQEEVGWPLFESASATPTQHWWAPLLGSLVYAWCGERSLAQRMILDAQVYVERQQMDGTPWVLDWTEAALHVLNAVQGRADGRDIAQSLSTFHRVQDTRAERTRPTDEHVHITRSIERHMERWLNARGLTLKRAPRLEVDDLELPSLVTRAHDVSISLERRHAMRRLLGALIAHHTDSASRDNLSTDDLFEAGWPGELATPESRRARVYNTISRLRRLGLDGLIAHDGEGYALDPLCVVTLTVSLSTH